MSPVRYKRAGSAAATLTAGPNFGDGSPTVALSVGTVSLSAVLTDALAGKDTWADNVVLCPINTAHPATDLQLEGVVRKDIWMAWDLTSRPAGATVSAATLKLNVKTAALTGDNSTLAHIPNADETWNEATLRCDSGAAPGGPITLTDFQGPLANTFWTSVGEKSIALNSTARTRIASRMSVGFYSIVLRASVLHTNCVLESADEGTDNILGPRLSLTYTAPLP